MTKNIYCVITVLLCSIDISAQPTTSINIDHEGYAISQQDGLTLNQFKENDHSIFHSITYYQDFIDPIISSSISPKKDAEKYLIYPTPASNFIHVEALENSMNNFVHIYNKNDELVLRKRFIGKHLQIDLRNLNEGEYILKVLSFDQVSFTSKFIKEYAQKEY